VVCGGDAIAPASSCRLHSWSNCGEGGGEVGKSRQEGSPGVSDGDGDELDSIAPIGS